MPSYTACGVRVLCRIRPLNKREAEMELNAVEDERVDFDVTDGQRIDVATLFHTDTFAYDRIFESTTSQDDVFKDCAMPAIQDVLDGYNGTIFCYGQTGSGKTYTMMGDFHDPSCRGIVPRVNEYIFQQVAAENGTNYAVECSYLEIYNEMVNDLLDPNSTNLNVRESPKAGFFVAGLKKRIVKCKKDIEDCIQLGEKNRATACTLMNDRSSRSHSLLQISIQQKLHDGATMSGRMNLVDLAGSEKVAKTGARGQTLIEAKKINQSLSALGKCIHLLSNQSKKSHIPFRDSKLTKILQDSLGGNTKTTIVICISSAFYNYEETISTLKFGSRAKSIETKVKTNISEKTPEELKSIISNLKRELALSQTSAMEYKTMTEDLQRTYADLAKAVQPTKNVISASEPNLAKAMSPRARSQTPPPPAKESNESLRERFAVQEEELVMTKEMLSTLRIDYDKLSDRNKELEEEVFRLRKQMQELKEENAKRRRASSASQGALEISAAIAGDETSSPVKGVEDGTIGDTTASNPGETETGDGGISSRSSRDDDDDDRGTGGRDLLSPNEVPETGEDDGIEDSITNVSEPADAVALTGEAREEDESAPTADSSPSVGVSFTTPANHMQRPPGLLADEDGKDGDDLGSDDGKDDADGDTPSGEPSEGRSDGKDDNGDAVLGQTTETAPVLASPKTPSIKRMTNTSSVLRRKSLLRGTQEIRRGWLQKDGYISKGKKLFCVLTPDSLNVFDDSKMRTNKGTMSLKDAYDVRPDPNAPEGFVLYCTGRSHLLYAVNPEEKTHWVKGLQDALDFQFTKHKMLNMTTLFVYLPDDTCDRIPFPEQKELQVSQYLRDVIAERIAATQKEQFGLVETWGGGLMEGDWIIEGNCIVRERVIPSEQRLEDLFYRWERDARIIGCHADNAHHAFRLSFRKVFFFTLDPNGSTAWTVEFEYRQAVKDVIRGQIDVGNEFFLLAAYQLHADMLEEGITNPTMEQAESYMSQRMHNYVPREYYRVNPSASKLEKKERRWRRDILRLWLSACAGVSKHGAFELYLRKMQEFPLYGAQYFTVKSLPMNQGVPAGLAYLAVNQNAVFILKRKDKKCPKYKDALAAYEIGDLKSWRFNEATFTLKCTDPVKKEGSVAVKPGGKPVPGGVREFTFRTTQGRDICGVITQYARQVVLAMEYELASRS